jgi:glyoxylase-like metal-dependent hydrolase (beta-lactamase superfamily II)
MSPRPFPEIVPLDVGTFTFAADEPWAGEQGVVVAYAIRRREGVLLFDTGFGFGSRELDERYHTMPRRLADVLGEAGIRIAQIDLVANCHLHADHAGQNATLPNIPIHVQRAELARARAGGYTILDWIDGPAVQYVEADGDHDLVPGVRVLSTPGHSPGHQSLVVDQPDGRVVLTGQAVYGLDEWLGAAGREGRSTAPDPDAYDSSVARIRAIEPARVLFAHDRRPWSRRGREGHPC